jgi:hypothetical protein
MQKEHNVETTRKSDELQKILFTKQDKGVEAQVIAGMESSLLSNL